MSYLTKGERLPKFVEIPVLLLLISLFVTILYKFRHHLEVLQTHSLTLVLFTSLGLLVVTALIWALRKNFCILLLLIPVIVVASGNILASLGISVFLFSSYALGKSVCSRTVLLKNTDSVFGILFSLLSGVAINSYLIWTAMHFRVNFPIVYWVFFVSEILLCWRFANIRILRPLPVMSIGQVAILLQALVFLPYCLVPSYSFDDVVCHLFIPHQTALFGIYDFSPTFISGLNFSMLPIGGYTATFILGGEYAVRLLNLAVFCLGFLAIEAWVRKNYSNTSALVAASAAFSTPFIHWQITTVFADSFFFASAALLTVSVLEFSKEPSQRKLFLLSTLAGIGFLSKQQTLFLLVPIAAYCLSVTVKRSTAKPIQSLLTLSLPLAWCVAIIIPPLLHNYLKTGNPFFPFMNEIFRSPYFPSEPFRDRRWDYALNGKTLWDLTFNGSNYIENSRFSFGFIPFLISSSVIIVSFYLAIKRQFLLLGLLALVTIYTIILHDLANLYMRYFLGIVPALAIVTAATIHTVTIGSRKREIAWGVIFSTVILLNLSAQYSTVNTVTPYPVKEAFTKDYSGSTLAYNQNFKLLFDRAGEQFGKDSTGLLVDSALNYFSQTRLLSNFWHFPAVYEVVNKSLPPESLAQEIVNHFKISYVILPLEVKDTPLQNNGFRKYLHEISRSDDFGLYSISL